MGPWAIQYSDIVKDTINKEPIGIIGLGLMGSALARRLSVNFDVIGFDTNPKQLVVFEKLGGKPLASSAQVAAACRRIVLSLPSSVEVKSVIRQMGKNLLPNSIVIDMTTGEPHETALLGLRLFRHKVHYLDATVAGNSDEVLRGLVLVMAGGEFDIFQSCRDFFKCFARRAFHVGSWGSGARMKLIFNLVLGLNRAVLAEALSFACAAGVPPEQTLKILKQGTAYSRVMDNKGEKMVNGDFATQAKLSQHLKDVRLILAMGRRVKAKLPLCSLHRKLIEQLEINGHGALDNSAIIKAFEQDVPVQPLVKKGTVTGVSAPRPSLPDGYSQPGVFSRPSRVRTHGHGLK